RGGAIGRRAVPLKAMGAAVGAMGVAALFPIRSLGPRPGRSLATTAWRDGLKLVTDSGDAVRADDVPLNRLVPVFPEGHAGAADLPRVPVRAVADAFPCARGDFPEPVAPAYWHHTWPARGSSAGSCRSWCSPLRRPRAARVRRTRWARTAARPATSPACGG